MPIVGLASDWCEPTDRVALRNGDVHVWAVPLVAEGYELLEYWRLLSSVERQRAKNFHFEKDRIGFVVSHGALRSILATYLAVEPGRLDFHYGRQGKPALVSPRGAAPVNFNLSHSGELGLIAVSACYRVGVDVEKIRANFATSSSANSFFSKQEVKLLTSIPSSKRVEAFFNCWTRKEAYLKGTGLGLSIPLDQFDVSLDPETPPALLEARHAPNDVGRWCLYDLSPAPGYSGALAVEARKCHCTRWRWRFRANALH